MKKLLISLVTLSLAMTISSCTQSASNDSNPLLEEWSTPYGVPPFDQIRSEHFAPAIEHGFSLHNEQIDAITSNSDVATFNNTILAFDNSDKELAETSLIFSMLCGAEITPELQAAQEKLMPAISSHYDQIMLNDKLFERIKSVYDRRKELKLNADQMRLTEKMYDSFVRSGALLGSEQKEQLKAINEQLSITSVKFGNNLLAENKNFILEITQEEAEGIPASITALAKLTAKEMGKEGKLVFTLDKPSMLPFLTYAKDRSLREKLYKGYIMRGNNDNEFDNKQLINDFIKLRTEKAHLLGYDNYAEYVVSDQMAGTTDAVYDLLNQIWTPALESAKAEVEKMKPLLYQDDKDATLESWDWWYYAEKVRKRDYNLDEEMLRPYLSLENVQGGIFFLANRLYGITFRPIVVPTYQKDVTAYEVLDVDQSHIGVLYLDFFPRSGKSGGAWCGNYREQSYENGERVAPVVSIVCNFTPPTANTPSLLTVDEAETFFHEFGHALHFLFHDVKYRGLSEVEGDFVELPSQIMENWAFEPELLKQYAVHYRSGDVMSQFLIDKVRKTSLFNQGFATTELTAAALSDMDIHSTSDYKPFDVNEYETKVLTEQRGLIPQIEPRYHYTYFSHIFDGGYSAGYYFYLWAEVLDKDAFEAFKESGDLFNKQIAAKFRTEVLERGGSRDGMSMYRAFRGNNPDKQAMLVGRGLAKPEPKIDTVETAK